MRWQLASTFAFTAMSAACYGPTRIVCEQDGVATGVLCPDNLECTGNTGVGEVLCAEPVDVDACAGSDRERTPCSSELTVNGLCIASVCTSCISFPDDFECRYEQWTQMVSPAAMLVAISVGSANDAYAVGGESIFHYDGKRWTAVATLPGVSLRGVVGDVDEPFAVGFDGTVYRGVPPMLIGTAPRELHAIWGNTANDVVAVGKADVIGRWDGTSWMWSIPNTTIPAPAWQAVAGVGDAIIAVGTGRVATVTGVNFSTVAGFPADHATDFLASVWGTSANDFYVAGTLGTAKGVIHHYLDGAWLEPVETSQRLNALWGNGTTIFAVGEGGLIATFDGATWSEQTIEGQPSFRGISGSERNAMAVTSTGAVWRLSPR